MRGFLLERDLFVLRVLQPKFDDCPLFALFVTSHTAIDSVAQRCD